MSLLLVSLLTFSVPANSRQALQLNKDNTIVLNDQVDRSSVKDVINQLREKDKILPGNEPIYLILNTPGGSVIDGMDIVSMAQSLKRPVHTVTVFAASMGFVIAQHLNIRYILQNGILMSHRMKTGMGAAEVGGELDEALSFAKAISRVINNICAQRLSMSVEAYEARIADEWWLYGQHAVDNKAADEIITVSCSEGLINVGKCPF